MGRNLLVTIGVLILIALAGGFFYLRNASNPQTPTPSPTPVSEVTPTKTVSPTLQVSASPSGEFMMKNEVAEVTVNEKGFNPQTINIKKGTKVTWTNDSSVPSNVSSDTHPTHTLWPFLNLGTFGSDQSISVLFNEAGTYTYHNHLIPTQKGTIIVK